MKRTLAIFLTLLLIATLLPASVAEQAVGTDEGYELTESELEPWIEAERALSASESEGLNQAQIPMVEFKEPTEPVEIWDGTIATGYAGGTGTATDPYLIVNGAQLAYLAQQVNTGYNYSDGKYFKLTAHICLNDTTNWQSWATSAPANEWVVIGASLSYSFRGIFDGNGYSVSGIYINKTGETDADNCQGLFGYCFSGATIANLAVRDSYIKGHNQVGGVVGYIFFGTVTNCYNTATISGMRIVGGLVGYNDWHSAVTDCYNTGTVSGTGDVGGVVGYNSQGTVTTCHNTGNVSSNSNVGGVLGYNSHGTVTTCYNTGTISGTGDVGGVVGDNYWNSSVTNCYNMGTVSGTDSVGGVVGDCAWNSSVTNCYNIGTVSGTDSVGGVVGRNYEGTVSNCYYLDTCGATAGVGSRYESIITNVISLTDAQLQVQENFVGFDFHNVWAIEPVTGYPYPQFMNGLDSSYGELSAIWDGSVASGFDSGSGTENDPYIIKTAAQLACLASSVNSGTTYSDLYIELANDIELNNYDAKNWIVNATPWIAIGTSSNSFHGNFNGNGFAISGIYIDGLDNQGLFGYCSEATITNISIKDSYIKGCYYVGGVVGYIFSSTVSDCYNTGTVSSTGDVGGVVGCIGSSAITNCYNTGMVSGAEYVGGVAGRYNDSYVAVCYNTGEVRGIEYVGGVCGTGSVFNCYNVGTISGAGSYVGAAVGFGSQLSCYFLEGSGKDNGFGTALTEAELKLESSFVGFDFYSAWAIEPDTGYPYPQFIKNLDSSYGETSAIWDGSVASGFDSGSGTQSNPYIIKTAAQLAYLASSVNSGTTYSGLYIELANDIELNDYDAKYWILNATPWTPIGTSSNSFRGNFNGKGFAISGIYIDSINSYQGLFGYCGYGATIANLAIKDSYIKGDDHVGGVVGWNYYDSTVTNCYNTGTVIGTGDEVGGVVGCNFGTVTGCHNVGTIIGDDGGGVVGFNRNAVTNCHNTGTISGSDVGGVIGWNYENSTVTNCYNIGAVSGGGAGGVVGINSDTVSNCYNTGTVSGNSNVGGVVGESSRATVTNCYNTGKVSGGDYVGGVAGWNYENSTVNNCYNAGMVSGIGNYVGGVVGQNLAYDSSAPATVKDCYYLDTCGVTVGATNGGGGGTETIENVIALTDAQLRVQANYVGFDFEGDSANDIDPVWTMEGNIYYPYAELAAVPHDMPVPVLGIAATESLEIAVTGTAEIEYTITPSDAANQAVAFATDDETIATVDENGVVIGVSAGTTKITTTTEDGGFTAETTVTVHPDCIVTYTADGETVETCTVHWGDTLTEIPDVPAKAGYSGEWDTDLAGVLIKQDYTVTAVYTENFLYGDADCNGSIEAADAAAILRYVVKLPNSDLSQLGKVQGDVAEAFDGEPDSSDAAAILRFIVKIIDSLGP
ncbi:MAG: GLUG motif-containing protein [Clostridia bacterium]|nr:GLUG motif-containing protein [Clostridia bacterium]